MIVTVAWTGPGGPEAAVWVNDGGEEEVAAALAWAEGQAAPARVDVWPGHHQDPLGAARALLTMTEDRALAIVDAWDRTEPPRSLRPDPEEVRARTGASWGEWSAAHRVLRGLAP